VRPRRVDAATRVSLVVLTKLFEWRGALVVVQPATLLRWHRAGWRLFWRRKSRPGRPPIPPELRALIRRMGRENPLWGEERIANELLLKLGIQISPRTVSKYLPKRPRGQPRGDGSGASADLRPKNSRRWTDDEQASPCKRPISGRFPLPARATEARLRSLTSRYPQMHQNPRFSSRRLWSPRGPRSTAECPLAPLPCPDHSAGRDSALRKV